MYKLTIFLLGLFLTSCAIKPEKGLTMEELKYDEKQNPNRRDSISVPFNPSEARAYHASKTHDEIDNVPPIQPRSVPPR